MITTQKQHDQIQHDVDWLQPLVERAYGLDHQMNVDFLAARTVDARDRQAVLHSFSMLPDEEQERVLNGWRPQLLSIIDDRVPEVSAPCLVLTADDARHVEAAICRRPEFSAAKVQIGIAYGATKSEAIACLDGLREKLDANWDQYVSLVRPQTIQD